MDKGEKAYGIVITATAKMAYFELLHYLYAHYSIDRANELAEAILDEPLVLIQQPELGSQEPRLKHRTPTYRYLIFRRSEKATVKIIYFVDAEKKTIYITDFFPTEKHPEGLSNNG